MTGRRSATVSTNVTSKKVKYINDLRSCASKLRSDVMLHSQSGIIGTQSGIWSYIMHGLPVHLVQEIEVCTVHVALSVYTFAHIRKTES